MTDISSNDKITHTIRRENQEFANVEDAMEDIPEEERVKVIVHEEVTLPVEEEDEE